MGNKESSKLWRKMNPEVSKEHSKKNYHKHKHEDKYIAYKKAYAQSENQKEKANERAKKYYLANKDKVKKQTKKWRKDNPEKYKAQNIRNKIQRRGYGTPTESDIIFTFQQYTVCVYCLSDSNLTIDHIVPLSCGGSNNLDNLCIACGPCNSSKGNKPLLLWLCSK